MSTITCPAAEIARSAAATKDVPRGKSRSPEVREKHLDRHRVVSPGPSNPANRVTPSIGNTQNQPATPVSKRAPTSQEAPGGDTQAVPPPGPRRRRGHPGTMPGTSTGIATEPVKLIETSGGWIYPTCLLRLDGGPGLVDPHPGRQPGAGRAPEPVGACGEGVVEDLLAAGLDGPGGAVVDGGGGVQADSGMAVLSVVVGEEGAAEARASSGEANVPGKTGQYFSVLNMASE